MKALMIVALLNLVLTSAATAKAEEPGAWALLRDGKAALFLRHALAPGVGDPPDFTLGDCGTQRNLNAEGLEQAKSWQPFLAERGIQRARIYTSQWCRALDTAKAMNIGEVRELAPLNSFFEQRENAGQQTRAVREFLNQLNGQTPIILVTHQVNISALANVYTSSNEGVIIALPMTETPRVLARVSP